MKKRILSVVLSAAMLLSTAVMSGCKSSSDDVKAGALTTKNLKNIYSAEEVSFVGTELENWNINNIYKLDGSRLLIDATQNEGEYETKMYITDADFKSFSALEMNKPSGENVETYIGNIAADSATGEVWYIKNVYTYSNGGGDTEIVPRDGEVVVNDVAYASTVVVADDDYWYGGNKTVEVADDDYGFVENKEENFLVKVDASGKIESETDLSAVLKYTDENGNEQTAYMNQMLLLPDGLFFNCGDRFMVIDKNTLEVTSSFQNENGEYFDSVFTSASGDVYFTSWGENGVEAYKLNVADGTRTKVDFPMADRIYDYSFAPGADGYDFYVSDRDAFYGYNISDEEPTEICSYINSDINNGWNTLLPAILDDGRLVVNFRDGSTGESSVLILTRLAPEQVKEKYVINVAGNYIDDSIKSALIKFNRTSDEYKVVFTDYSKYNSEENDYNGGEERLGNDLISKDKAPDIVLLNSYGSIDAEGLIAKGVFADIEKFMDEDESFNKDDYLTNVFEASKVNGGLYFISPAIQVVTLAGKKSIFGDKTHWTMNEFIEMHRNLADGEKMFANATRESEGDMFITLAKDEYIGEDGKCSFNSEGFKSILEYLKDIPANYEAYNELWNNNPNYYEDIQRSFRDGSTKLYPTYIYNFNILPEIEAYLGEEPVLIGYPTSDGSSNGAIIRPIQEIAITSGSKVPAGAWSALKCLLSDDYQNKFAGVDENGRKQWSYAFPIKKNIIEKKLTDDLKPDTHREYDEDGNEIFVEDDNTTWIGEEEIKLRRSTAEDAEKLYDVIKNASVVVRNNKQISDIIMQEAASYFDGQKTVDDVAEIINSRIQILVNERR